MGRHCLFPTNWKTNPYPKTHSPKSATNDCIKEFQDIYLYALGHNKG